MFFSETRCRLTMVCAIYTVSVLTLSCACSHYRPNLVEASAACTWKCDSNCSTFLETRRTGKHMWLCTS